MTAVGIKRLNWGCGGGKAGWINSDRRDGPGVDICCDIGKGLPLESDSLDYIVSIHALQEIAYPDLVPVLAELRRVLKPKGILRLGLPDLDKNIEAYLGKDRSYFLVPDEDAKSIGGKLIVQLLWYGFSRTLFTYDFISEILVEAGFVKVSHCPYRKTHGAYPEIVELDNREAESLFVEAVK